MSTKADIAKLTYLMYRIENATTLLAIMLLNSGTISNTEFQKFMSARSAWDADEIAEMAGDEE